jgi:diacylglycerol kinase (ATP)
LPINHSGQQVGVLVVTNELAGRTEREAVNTVIEVLEAAGPVELARSQVEADLDCVLDRRAGRTLVVVGGDGSLHAALTFLWRRGEASECPVGLVPLGTGNDFARGVGIPIDPVEAARLIVSGTPQPTDLVTDDAGGVVVNAVHVGAGVDAAVLARPLKPYLKIASFPVGAALAGFRAPVWRLRIEVDGKAVVGGRRRVLMAGLSNAPTIAGGTAVLAPDASVTDGMFDVMVTTAVAPLARVGYAVGLLRGTHSARDDVQTIRGRTLAISGESFRTNADGELAGPFRRRVWTIQPGAWRCILPSHR